MPKARRRELDYKATEGIFFRYQPRSKHYKVFDPIGKRLVTERDLQFYEEVGFWKKVGGPVMGNGPMLEGSLVLGSSVTQESDDDSEEEEKEPSEYDNGACDPSVVLEEVEERAISQWRSNPRVDKNELKGMVLSLGKA